MPPLLPHLRIRGVVRWVCSFCHNASNAADWKEGMSNGLTFYHCPFCGADRSEMLIFPAMKYEWTGPPEAISPCDKEMRTEHGFWFCLYGCPGLINGQCCFHGFEVSPGTDAAVRLNLKAVFEPEPPVRLPSRKIIIKKVVKDGSGSKI